MTKPLKVFAVVTALLGGFMLASPAMAAPSAAIDHGYITACMPPGCVDGG